MTIRGLLIATTIVALWLGPPRQFYYNNFENTYFVTRIWPYSLQIQLDNDEKSVDLAIWPTKRTNVPLSWRFHPFWWS